METSSSTASQCRPRLPILTCSSSSVVHRSSLGNHANGTPIVRPSLRSTHMLSASKRTRVALTEELIPCPFDPLPVGLDDPDQLTKSSGIVAIIVGYLNRRSQPEFCLQLILFNMDVDWFTRRSFIGIEEKPEAALPKNDWHILRSL